jgi:hypothetical protein
MSLFAVVAGFCCVVVFCAPKVTEFWWVEENVRTKVKHFVFTKTLCGVFERAAAQWNARFAQLFLAACA